MKKVCVIILSVLICVCLIGCGSKSKGKASSAKASASKASVEDKESSTSTVTDNIDSTQQTSSDPGDKTPSASVSKPSDTTPASQAQPAAPTVSFTPGYTASVNGNKALNCWNIRNAGGKTYALCSGTSGGVLRTALVTLDSGRNYQGCLKVFSDYTVDTFAIIGSRIYVEYHANSNQDEREQPVYNKITVLSFDLSGGSERVDYEISGSYYGVSELSCSDTGGNWYLWLTSATDGTSLCKYNVNTKGFSIVSRNVDSFYADYSIYVKNGSFYVFTTTELLKFDMSFGNKTVVRNYSGETGGSWINVEEVTGGFKVTRVDTGASFVVNV